MTGGGVSGETNRRWARDRKIVHANIGHAIRGNRARGKVIGRGVIPRQSANGGARIGADNRQMSARNLPPDQRQDLGDEPAGGIVVRRVTKAGHENDFQPNGSSTRGRERIEPIRNDRAEGARRLEGRGNVGLLVGRVERLIDLPPDREFSFPHPIGRAQHAFVTHHLALLAHATEMQVMPIIDHPCSAVLADRQKGVPRDVRAAQQNAVQFVTELLDPVVEAGLGRAIEDLDPHLLQHLGVAGTVTKVMRPEFHHQPSLDQDAQEVHHGTRAGVTIRLRHEVIDHQHDLPLHRPVASAEHILAIGKMLFRQHRRPASRRSGGGSPSDTT